MGPHNFKIVRTALAQISYLKTLVHDFQKVRYARQSLGALKPVFFQAYQRFLKAANAYLSLPLIFYLKTFFVFDYQIDFMKAIVFPIFVTQQNIFSDASLLMLFLKVKTFFCGNLLYEIEADCAMWSACYHKCPIHFFKF